MVKVLIDANKFLEFYKATPAGPLVPLLVALGDHLLVPKQIVYEVQRNRVSVAETFLTQSWPKKPLHYSCPLHLMSFENKKLGDIEQRRTEINNRSTALQRDLDSVFTATVADIALGRDPVSIQLAPLFAKAVEATSAELASGRLRKEIGNPPGKRTDPLGDQLSWEQFLSHIKGEPLLWVITGDSDYYDELPDKMLGLNPILREDVDRATGLRTEVRCFKTLADGLKDALDTLALQPAKKLSPAEIDVIREAEFESAARSKTPSVICPACGGATSWRALQAVQGYMGGIVFFTCPLCGAKFDTE